ncbi:MAG: glycosyltransferase [Candidatus Aenigmarchaeota archaeon]|nr:glycosyltransferase [Candidatus Aenigmarchaeota archaeon]
MDTRKFFNRKSEGFYLSASRLDELKRIDIMIEAFIRNGKELVIAGSGPDEKRLRQIAEGHENIRFTGAASEKELTGLYSRCTATLAAARDEDFGLVAVESMAAGKPCIAVNEGGFLETVKDGKSGVFFQPDMDSLNSAIERAEKIKWNPKAIMKEAKKYDTRLFEKKMKRIARKVMH